MALTLTRSSKREVHASELAFLSKETLSAGILIVAIFYNAALAFINAHFTTLSQPDVALFEAAITALAIPVIAFNFRANMLPWAILLTLLLLLHFALTIANQAFYPKLIRDAVDIPIFIALGIVYARGNIIRLMFYIQSVVLLGLLVELIAVDTYSSIFNILSYYVNTRDFTVQSFWNEGSTLFVSATRPDERFLLASLGIHRLSSVFLEPVSLGNYSILAAIFTLSFWRGMSHFMRFFFITTTLIILVGSDGRLAVVTCTILALASIIFPLLPRYSNVLYLPGAILFSVIIVTWFGLQAYGDDFLGRLTASITLLTSLDLAAILGLAADQSSHGFDSGISYFLITQSVIGLALVWLFVCFVPRYSNRTSIVFVHSICTYISLNLLVSYSLFSIKTAALMWFTFGYLLPELEWFRPSLKGAIRELNRRHNQKALGA